MSRSTVTLPVSNAALVEAIALLTSPVWGALCIANALAGMQTEPWQIVNSYTSREIVDEIIERSVSLDDVLAACSSVLVTNTPVFHMILEHDPRPKCGLCDRRHLVDHRTNEVSSCGRAQRLYNPPTWRWTRATQEAAL